LKGVVFVVFVVGGIRWLLLLLKEERSKKERKGKGSL